MVIVINQTDIELLSEWMKNDQHLPHNIHKDVLKRFLAVCDSDIELTKNIIEGNYKFRNKHPEIFLKRDPHSEDLRNIWKYSDIVILPGLTPDDAKVIYYNFTEFDPDNVEFSGEAWVRLYFMLVDVYHITPDPSGFSVQEVHIFDAANMNLKKIKLFSISVLRALIKFAQEYHSSVLKEIHFINCPTYLSTILMVCKPFINRDIYKMFQFHAPFSQTLFDYVPKAMMPKEFKGNAGSINDIKKKWMLLLDKNKLFDGHEPLDYEIKYINRFLKCVPIYGKKTLPVE